MNCLEKYTQIRQILPFILCFPLIFLTACSSQQLDIVLNPETNDLGLVWTDTNQVANFDLVNAADFPITVKKIKLDCDCLGTSLHEGKTIAAGELISFEVVLNVNVAYTVTKRTIELTFSNEEGITDTKQCFIRFRGLEEIESNPSRIIIAEQPAYEPWEYTVTLSGISPDMIDNVTFETSIPNLKVNHIAWESDVRITNYVVNLTSEGFPPGQLQEYVRIHDHRKGYRSLVIPITGHVIEQFTATPESLFVLRDELQAGQEYEIKIHSNVEKKFSLQKIKCNSPGLICETIPSNTDYVRIVKVFSTKETMPKKESKGSIEMMVKPEKAKEQPLKIPVFVR